eukprot:9601908-Alexandrium_andersonii.AAC.1
MTLFRVSWVDNSAKMKLTRLCATSRALSSERRRALELAAEPVTSRRWALSRASASSSFNGSTA